MLSKTLEAAINDQINFELSSAYLYLSMSAHFEGENLGGFAKWMHIQYEEENEHAMRFYKYVFERGGQVVLKAIPQPAAKFKSPLDVFKQVLEHERKITVSINKIYDIAVKEKDYAAQSALKWFVDEQVEEEKNASDIIAMLEMAGNSPMGLLMANSQLGKRKED
jgi:ferritin